MRHFLFNCFVLAAVIVAALLLQAVLGVQTRIDNSALGYAVDEEKMAIAGNWVEPTASVPGFAKVNFTCDTKKKRCTEKMQRFLLKGLQLVAEKPVSTDYKITRDDTKKLLAHAEKTDIAIDKTTKTASKMEDKNTSWQLVGRNELKTILCKKWFTNRLSTLQKRIGL